MSVSKKIKYDGDPKQYIIVDYDTFYCPKDQYDADTNHTATAFSDGVELQIYDLNTKAITGYAVSLEGKWCDRSN